MPGWRFDNREHEPCRAYLIGDPGQRILIRSAGGGKWCASGLIDHPLQVGYGNWINARIGFSSSRDPKSIANDIKNRLLPDYYSQWTAEKLKIENDFSKKRLLENRVNALLAVCPALESPRYTRGRYQSTDGAVLEWNSITSESEISVHVNPSDSTLDIDIGSVPESTGYQIIALVKNHIEQEKKGK